QPPWRERVVRFKRELEEVLEHSPHRRSHRAFQALEAWRTGTRRGAAEAAMAPPPAQPPLRGEDRYPFDPLLARAGMPGGVRRRLLGTDLTQLVQQRRTNYAWLAQGLAATDLLHPLRPQLDTATCPWVFPLRVAQRDRFDRGWRAQGVALHTFGIWLHSALQQADTATRADAEQLAAELLCLSVHQGLTRADMERAVEVVGRHAAPGHPS
ncbi:MAG: DegT/DnrJ/EryC1/StrS family aminotransferase, partial [Burkholderiales bacterium]|nr:DegT/DnrJ/EryC1/StrS family aminotransferase [Burkholderiales bacterium]